MFYTWKSSVVHAFTQYNICNPQSTAWIKIMHGQFVDLLLLWLLHIFSQHLILLILRQLHSAISLCSFFLHIYLHVQLALPDTVQLWLPDSTASNNLQPGNTCVLFHLGEKLRLTWICWACSLSSGVEREEVWQLLMALVMNPLPWAYRLS